MNKKLLSFLLIAVLICSLSENVFADDPVPDQTVTFNAEEKLIPDESKSMEKFFSRLEPGDSGEYQIKVINSNDKTTRWYMSNSVISSLEDGHNISGGAYTYKLTYQRSGGALQTLYDSTQVGGRDNLPGRIGLHEATGNLEDYFFLDTLNKNETGLVTLFVALEGESQDNTYQNTAAEIKMRFAVEVSNPDGSRKSVKTGDETNLMPYYIGMTAAGLVFLYLALDAYTDRKYKKGRN